MSIKADINIVFPITNNETEHFQWIFECLLIAILDIVYISKTERLLCKVTS